mmetsp:Transcript_1464/g.2492  ORF Transcript_1464/g.2492 Transcript_1464/m.2492 type:complete len:226 (-) Transcript_1464:198-875(-)
MQSNHPSTSSKTLPRLHFRETPRVIHYIESSSACKTWLRQVTDNKKQIEGLIDSRSGERASQRRWQMASSAFAELSCNNRLRRAITVWVHSNTRMREHTTQHCDPITKRHSRRNKQRPRTRRLFRHSQHLLNASCVSALFSTNLCFHEVRASEWNKFFIIAAVVAKKNKSQEFFIVQIPVAIGISYREDIIKARQRYIWKQQLDECCNVFLLNLAVSIFIHLGEH